MSDNRECQKCGDYYTLRQECEPTAYCDLCAQTMLGDAEKQIKQLTKERDELKSELERVKEDRNRQGVIARHEALKISEGFKRERDELEVKWVDATARLVTAEQERDGVKHHMDHCRSLLRTPIDDVLSESILSIINERDQLAAKCEKLCEELSGCVSDRIDPSVNVGWMRCSPYLPRYVQGLEAKVFGLIAAASDMIDFDQENKVPVCKCCGVELDEKGNGHRADCLANKILEACQ